MALEQARIAKQSLTRRVASQGAILFAGFAGAQACSFLRNAILGHVLAKGDFGIAATLTMILQLVETMTDTGADRLIVSAPGGSAPRFMATAHAVLIGRGFLTALVLYLAAEPFCRFLEIGAAQGAFELIALAPLIKGFTHLDMRRAQRDLQNRPQMLAEVGPQVVGLALTFPMLTCAPTYSAVAALALAQAVAGVIISHTVARNAYAVAADRKALHALIAFGWPIWLSAFPLIAVYQGDRLIIGKLYGMDALASYSVAFLVTMVPALIAAKVGHALMLPLLSSQRDAPCALAGRYASLSSVTAVAAALYLIVFGVAGGTIVPLAFGSQYSGLGALTGWLALMWTVRMVQVVPGMAVMAHGQTRPFLVAGLIRAISLPAAIALAVNGYNLEALAAAGTAGELASLIYIVWRAGQCHAGLPAISWQANLWLAGVAIAVALTSAGLMSGGLSEHMAAVLLLAACATGYAVTAQTALRDGIATLRPLRHSAA